MKKRMIAWLLCACMTFTAAPEMLLADVAGNAQQTQEENSFKEKGTVETQTVEQDDEKSAVTEKIKIHDSVVRFFSNGTVAMQSLRSLP